MVGQDDRIEVPRGVPGDWIQPRKVPVSSGHRGSLTAETQLQCTVAGYEVDILLREYRDPAELEIVGQITMENRVFEPAAGIVLELVGAESSHALMRLETDRFGEFDLASRHIGVLGLRLGAEEDAPCVLLRVTTQS